MTTNDTRTTRERAEELAADEWRRDEALAAEAERQTPFNGWENAMENAALQQKFIDGANWQATRDAEPTTVSAEQIEAAERRGAVKALRDFADGVRFPNHWILFRRVEDDSPVSVGDLLRETARNIEGDPA